MKIKGILFTVSSAFLFGFTPVLAKSLYQYGLSSNMVVFLRYFLAILPLFIICKIRKIDMKVTRNELVKIGCIAIFGHSLTTITLYGSYAYISVGTATVLHFYYPIFVAVLSRILLKKTMSNLKKVLLLISTIGVSCFLNSIGNGQMIGIFMSLFSALTFAFYMVATEKFALQKMDSFKITFYFALFVSFITFIVTVVNRDFTLHLSAQNWGNIIILSLATSVFGLVFLQTGIKMIGARDASILSTAEPITSLVFGALLLNEAIKFNEIIGSILILVSVITIIIIDSKVPIKKNSIVIEKNS